MNDRDDVFDDVFNAQLHETGQLQKYETAVIARIIKLVPGWTRSAIESIAASNPSYSGYLSLYDVCHVLNWPVALKVTRGRGLDKLDQQLWRNSSRISVLETLDAWHDDESDVFCGYRGVVFQWPRRSKYMVLYESDVALSKTGFCWVVDSNWPSAYRRVNFYILQTLKNFVTEISDSF